MYVAVFNFGDTSKVKIDLSNIKGVDLKSFKSVKELWRGDYVSVSDEGVIEYSLILNDAAVFMLSTEDVPVIDDTTPAPDTTVVEGDDTKLPETNTVTETPSATQTPDSTLTPDEKPEQTVDSKDDEDNSYTLIIILVCIVPLVAVGTVIVIVVKKKR